MLCGKEGIVDYLIYIVIEQILRCNILWLVGINMEKIIHYCWFGGNEKSQIIKKCINSWKKYMPEYKIMEWNEKNIDLSFSPFVIEAYKNKKWAFVSDVIRLKVLYEYGGIYLDTDVELYESLDDLLKNNDAFFSFKINIKLILG